MEPDNRPYVDASTEPGDVGTEEWSDTLSDSEPPTRGPLATPTGTDEDDIVEGSPADDFAHDADAIAARNDPGQDA
jgi:hypothetical protein